MVLKDMKSAYTVLKIFAETSKVVLYAMETGFSDKTEMFKSNLSETIGRLQDVLDNIEE